MFHGFKRSNRLKAELTHWVDEQLISQEQAEKLRLKYELDKEAPWYFRSGFILKSIALLFAAAGLLLFISENWNHLNIPARMSIGLVPLMAAYLIGFYHLYKDKKEEAELSFFMASLLFAVNIFLQAQIFHIDKYFPNAFLWWIIGTLPFAFYFNSNVLKIAVHAGYAIWISFLLEHGQFHFMSPVIIGLMAISLYRFPNPVQLVLIQVNLYLCLQNMVVFIDEGHSYAIHFLAFFTLVYFLQEQIKKQYSEAFINRLHRWAATGIIFMFYLYTFEELLEEIYEEDISIVTYGTFALAGVFFSLQKKSREAKFLLAVSLAILAFQITGSHLGKDSGFELISAIALSAGFLGLAIWMIRNGMLTRVKRDFMIGIVMLLALGLAKYIDYFENYVTTALIFIACGGLLWGINYYWNKRHAE